MVDTPQPSNTSRAGHLAFVSDGSLFQILGVLMVVNELLRSAPVLAEKLTVWVGLPRGFHGAYEPYFELFREQVSVRLFEAEPAANDPYFVKLGLAGLVEQLTGEDPFLYLDYDHLVLGPLCMDANQADGILVSSEVKQLDQSIAPGLGDLPMPAPQAGQTHFNNSLIFTSVSRMRALVGPWRQVYHRLTGLPPEKREEIAFCLAAQAVGESLVAAPHQLQEHFRDDAGESVLFHYGGAHAGARHLKQFLRERAAVFCWDGFTAECLCREHRMMQARLADLSVLSV